MSVQTRAELRETARDCLIVSSFGFWALLLGFVPVVAIHTLFTQQINRRRGAAAARLIRGSTCGQIRAN